MYSSFSAFMNDLAQKTSFCAYKFDFYFLEIEQYPVGLHPRLTRYLPGVEFGEDEIGPISILAGYASGGVCAWCLPWPGIDRTREMGPEVAS